MIYSAAFFPLNLVFAMFGLEPTPVVAFANFMSGTITIDVSFETITTFFDSVGTKLTASMPKNSSISNTNGGGSIWKDIFLSDRPLSGISYVRDIARKLTLVPEAKAADTYGFSRLAPIQPLWKLTRNIAYFFFVIIILIAAFMIMFKVKMSPQAVVTIQSALPKIVVTLILVTFSYAIAGFMVDLIYVVMGLFSQFFTPIVTNYGSVTATYKFLNGWLGDGFFSILVYSAIYLIFSVVFALIVAIVSILNLNFASLIFGVILLIFFLINAIILIVYIFVGLFNLFKALAGFYVAVIFGPIQLALGALPSSHGTFGKWLKSIIGKLLVFPAQGILWYFGFLFLFGAVNAVSRCTNINWGGNGVQQAADAAARAFASAGAPAPLIEQFTNWSPSGNCWGPPLLGNAGAATAIAFLLISASCILLLGKVHKMIESALAGREFDMESAISAPIKMGASSVGSVTEYAGRVMGESPNPATVIRGAGVRSAGEILQILTKSV